MNETSEEAPKVYRVLAPFVQCRVRNPHPVGRLRGPWVVSGAKQGGFLSEADLHPDDLKHLLSAMTPGPFSTPFLEEVPAGEEPSR